MKYIKIYEDFSQKDYLSITPNKLTNYKQLDNGYGKVSKGTQGSNDYRLGDKVEVYMTAEKHAGKTGIIVLPTDTGKIKEENFHEMIKVKFDEGGEDYVSKYQLNKI